MNFNKVHSSARSVIERTFALLRGRFRRLKYIDMHRFDFVPQTIAACCVLHNICLLFNVETAEANNINVDENNDLSDDDPEFLNTVEIDENFEHEVNMGELRRMALANDIFGTR